MEHSAQYRTEKDSVGTRQIPGEAYFGVQSLRGQENFPITGSKTHPEMIRSLACVKKAAALANREAGVLSEEKARAIVRTCDELLQGALWDAFIVDPIQGGAGTSLNMNANEVIANRAIELLGGEKGDYTLISPNDHVNCGQSTNDVIPTAGKITALRLLKQLQSALVTLHAALCQKAAEFDGILKMGRTQLQDAVPIRLGQEFAAYGAAVLRDIHRLDRAMEELYIVNMGGTAVGTGLNADTYYLTHIVPVLCQVSGLPLQEAADRIDATQNLDAFAAVSGIVKSCAINLSKMANDLRLLSSGPKTGLGEINLPAKQNGSSIMPGKVNPVIPEVVNQAAFLVAGHDVTITMAVEAGQLELNAFEPVIFYCLFQSLEALTGAVNTLVENCITGITANADRCRALVEGSVGIITAICPYVGYVKAAELAKKALHTGTPVRQLILEEHLLGEAALDRILDPVAMTAPKCAPSWNY